MQVKPKMREAQLTSRYILRVAIIEGWDICDPTTIMINNCADEHVCLHSDFALVPFVPSQDQCLQAANGMRAVKLGLSR